MERMLSKKATSNDDGVFNNSWNTAQEKESSDVVPVYSGEGPENNDAIIKNHLKDTKCGIGLFYPQWIQLFASKKAFVVVYALAGMQQLAVGSYFIGTMSTMEKNFNFSSKQSGMISAAWDLGGLLTSVMITYVAGKGHRTRWVAMGTLFIGISSFLRIIPFHILGSGHIVKMYTNDSISNSTDNSIMNNNKLLKMSTNLNCDSHEGDLLSEVTFYVTVISQIILGIGSAVYWTCGATYLDDNVRKNIVPAMLAIVQFIRLFGPTVGFLLSSSVLKIYVEPNSTPIINHEDPRWIGAWWMGWYPIAISSLVIATILMLFPKSLPRAAARNEGKECVASRISFSDFKQSINRILKNKIMMFNSFSSVCFTAGLMAYWTFTPKYMESQFRLSPSKSTFITGTVGILCNALGVMTAGLIISKKKPSPRSLAGWNVFVEIMDVIGHSLYSLISCPDQKYHGHWNDDSSWNLTEQCNSNRSCGTDIQYAPVCDQQNNLAYYSSCHAGCINTSMINESLWFTECNCVNNNNRSVIDGLCQVDCFSNLAIFVVMMGLLSFFSATGRSANVLIQFRCVEERDKSLSIGVTEALISLFAFIPSPIFYGMIMDWSCIVWGDNCGERGNCWLYDVKKLRIVFNLTAASFLLIGTILDCFVWYYSKDLKLYDEDINKDDLLKNKNSITLKTNGQNRIESELPLIRESDT